MYIEELLGAYIDNIYGAYVSTIDAHLPCDAVGQLHRTLPDFGEGQGRVQQIPPPLHAQRATASTR